MCCKLKTFAYPHVHIPNCEDILTAAIVTHTNIPSDCAPHTQQLLLTRRILVRLSYSAKTGHRIQLQELLYLPICCTFFGKTLRESTRSTSKRSWTCIYTLTNTHRAHVHGVCSNSQPSWWILRPVRMCATECGCVQRCFSKLRPVAERSVLKHGREIEGF